MYRKARNARFDAVEYVSPKSVFYRERAFRVKAKDTRILGKRKREIQRRNDRGNFPAHVGPVLSAANVQYEMADRAQAIDCGGLGAFHVLARNTGLIGALDAKLSVLKLHMPYHESDHVLNIAYNTLTGGTCLDDLERRRNDEAYLNDLGAERISPLKKPVPCAYRAVERL